MFSRIKQFSLPKVYGILIAVQSIHSAEEITSKLNNWLPVATSYLHNRFAFIPVKHLPGDSFLYLNVAVVVLLLLMMPFAFRANRLTLRVLQGVSIVELLNGFFHVIIAVALGAYFPGSLSGLLLIPASLLLLKKVAYVQDQVS